MQSSYDGHTHGSAAIMKKRSLTYGPHSRGQWRTVVTTVILLVVVAVLFNLQGLLHQELPIPAPPTVSRIVSRKPKIDVSKVAFLFLARHQMPLDFLWEHFFQGTRAHEYSVYIHARPGFVYTKNNTKCTSFVGRQLKHPVLVEWGEASMIQAERLLLAEALQDPLNARFILLSDSCAPLYNFRYIYDYVMGSQKSFVDSFVVPRDPRYNHKMAPIIWKEGWRKGSQWFVLIQKHAAAVVEDTTVFPVFQRFCKRLALPEFWSDAQNNSIDDHNCIPDEHYLQTLLATRGMWELERRSVTYSQWKNAQRATMDRRGWHPITFDSAKTTLKAIKEIQDIHKIHYVTESRMESCGIGGQPSPCYLFARKFNRGAGIRLLELFASYANGSMPHSQRKPHAPQTVTL